jgi:hypothetical protein
MTISPGPSRWDACLEHLQSPRAASDALNFVKVWTVWWDPPENGWPMGIIIPGISNISKPRSS